MLRKNVALIIAGPTGVGKTDLAICLAKYLHGELLSCDSVQVYKELSIGSNKWYPKKDIDPEQHLVDLISFQDQFTSANFYDACQHRIKEVMERGKLPILVGGTGFYLEWLMRGRPSAPPIDDLVALERVKQDTSGTWREAIKVLRTVDAPYADSLFPNDFYRLRRALAVFYATGKPLSSFSRYGSRVDGIEWHAFYLTCSDRTYIARRIDMRAAQMLDAGLLEEVWGLRKQGLTTECQAGRAIGYAETLAFYDSVTASSTDAEIETALVRLQDAIQSETRKYSRRQENWYYKREEVQWVQRPMPFVPFSPNDALCLSIIRSLTEEIRVDDSILRKQARDVKIQKAMRTYRSETLLDKTLIARVRRILQ